MSRIADNTAGLSRLAWTAGIVVGASLPHVPNVPLWIPVLLFAAVGWRFAGRLLRWPLPGRWFMWLITIAACGGVLVEYRTLNGLAPGTALLIVMVSLKFLEARTQRDNMLLTVIAYMLVFASLLTGGGLIKGLYLLAFVWITTLGLLQVGRLGPLRASLPTAKQAGKLLLQALPLMLVLFLFFPRLPGPLWSMPGDSTSATSGLSDSMSPGDITELGLSDAIAFRVDFDGAVPSPADLYWRGPVLTRFDGRRWDRPQGMRGDTSDTIRPAGNAFRYEVRLESGARPWAFALEMPVEWSTGERRRDLRMSSEYQLLVWPPERLNQNLSYTVTSYPDYSARESLSDSQREVLTRLPPELNPRTRALIDELTADGADVRTVVDRALDVFRADGFFYTLTPPALGEHTADDFIFATKEGFCEHYASTFTIMMRMAGIPARVVAGYQGGELNSMGDYYIVRQANAHAWTEVWTEDAGWMRVDPISAVAPERIAAGATGASVTGQASITQRIGRMTLLRQIALGWDAVNTFWNEWVIDYGPQLQRRLLELLGFERPRSRELLLVAALGASLVMFGFAAWFGLRLRADAGRDPVARHYERFRRKLRRLAVEPLQTGEAPTAYARRASLRMPDAAAEIESITRSYLAARYEPDNAGRASKRLRELVDAFKPGYGRVSRSG